MKRKIYLVVLALMLAIFGISGNYPFYCKAKGHTDTIAVKSTSFNNNGYMPVKYTCDAENQSPAIEWSKGPAATKSYVLICDDPDAPSKVWVHWVLFNIPDSITSLEEHIPNDKTVLGSAVQGLNDSGEQGYSGPCPPGGTHHYHFRVYALDCVLLLGSDAGKSDVESAMKNHILAQGEIVGLYKRSK